MLEEVLDERLEEVELHDALHYFCQKWECGIKIMEAKFV